MSTVLVLVQSPHTQTTNVARRMVARRDRVVRDDIGADETDLGIIGNVRILRSGTKSRGSSRIGDSVGTGL